jgi:hypothetical protein
MRFNAAEWIKLSLLSLFIVAALGALMRYKIAFDFPFLNQKNILHAHSHFAFLGWISQVLYVLLVRYIVQAVPGANIRQYTALLCANLVCAYAILVSFVIQGYGPVSITFLSVSIAIACFFASIFFSDLRKVQGSDPSVPWFRAAIWFNLLSSAGTLYLGYMMASHRFNENWYLAAVYFYLHFQYNGFFLFSCGGLAVNEAARLLPDFRYDKRIFTAFFVSAVPAYFLSVLWATLPAWLYVIVALSAVVQLLGWLRFAATIRKALPGARNLKPYVKYLAVFVSVAFSVKLLLQLGSTVPVVSKLAFGFRPVVIAYLHLVLLAFITVFLLAYFYSTRLLRIDKTTRQALTLFTAAVFLNELVLAVQGAASFGYVPIGYVNEMLFGVSVLLFAGALMLLLSQVKYRKKVQHPLTRAAAGKEYSVS